MKPHKHAEVIRAWADGAQIEYRPEGRQHWTLCGNAFKPSWAEEYEYRVKPEKVYPDTTIRFLDLASLLDSDQFQVCGSTFSYGSKLEVTQNSNSTMNDVLRAVANSALRHAIDAGQIVTKGEHESALIQLGEHLRGIAIAPNAARDMAIAEAVELAYGTSIGGACRLDLAAIIATIK